MYVKKNLMLWATTLVLAMPLMFAGNAGAGIGKLAVDGAKHDAATGQMKAPDFATETYCVAFPNTFDVTAAQAVNSSTPPPNAVKRLDLTPNDCSGWYNSVTDSGGKNYVGATGVLADWGGHTNNSPGVAQYLAIRNYFTSTSTSWSNPSAPSPITYSPMHTFSTPDLAAAACQDAGYFWYHDKSDTPGTNGAKDYCNAFNWTMDKTVEDSFASQGSAAVAWVTAARSNCLRCHNTGYMGSITNPSELAHEGLTDMTDFGKESYVNTGHQNMSRRADGMKWGIPGVTNSALANPELANADMNSDGSFAHLWIQEDYPRMPVNWGASTVALGYCGTALGVTGTGDVPDLAACATYAQACESPIMGNGGAGYPLGYATQALCEAARKPSTGLPGYVWTSNATAPLYWIYGGAGLEGGPAMMQAGSQTYKCGRCHTTGWSANNATDAAITGKTKLPYINPDWSSVDFTTLTAVGTTGKLLNPSITGYTISSWDQFGIQCSRCHIETSDNGHSGWGSSTTAGGDIVATCMTCHRMEGDPDPRATSNQNGYTATSPMGSGVTTANSNNAATPFTNKAAQPDGFAHHPDGPEFLNSPHAKFTGNWQQIGCPPYAISGYGDNATRAGNPAGTALTTLATNVTPTKGGQCSTGTMNKDGSTYSLYASKFAQAVVTDLGEPANGTAGGCTSCHDIHKPHNENVDGMGGDSALKHVCSDCHSKAGGSTITPQVDLAIINHPTGAGTPLADSNPCEICHQPAGMKHIWRINTDPNYSTYGNYGTAANGLGGATDGTRVNLSNTAADGAYANAVWIDIDNACGQCHGGGVANSGISTTTTATISGAVTSITIANTTGFASGKELAIAGAGVNGAAFNTIIASVSGNTVYLTYATAATHPDVAPGAAVTVAGNQTANGAPYFTKAQAAVASAAMHGGASGEATMNCTACHAMILSHPKTSGTPGAPSDPATCKTCHLSGTQQVHKGNTVDVQTTCGQCHGGSAGQGATHNGAPYATLADLANAAAMNHTVRYDPVSSVAPVVSHGTVTVSGNTVSFTDTSTDTDDTNKLDVVSVDWRDGSKSVGSRGSVFTHIYSGKRKLYMINHVVRDAGNSKRVSKEKIKVYAPMLYNVTGTVLQSDASTPIAKARVFLMQSNLAIKNGRTNTNGAFTFKKVLPGAYTIHVGKVGVTFGADAGVTVVGADVTQNITATNP